ncbi:MAG TPA: imidazole glycerol phosphate synthase cyclase subunit, partial [Chlorobaculum parvum]|nr:imidazole glycerol phosphate synthase cyclase subunit [Chlorobaculum parvum]
ENIYGCNRQLERYHVRRCEQNGYGISQQPVQLLAERGSSFGNCDHNYDSDDTSGCGGISRIAERFGSQAVVVAIDVKKVNGEYIVHTHSGKKPTAFEAVEWAHRVQELGAGEILLTSMDRDGTQEGYDNEILKRISTSVHIPVIASGGAGNLEHLYEGFTKGHADAALAASIFHFRTYSIREAKEYLRDKGIPVRL